MKNTNPVKGDRSTGQRNTVVNRLRDKLIEQRQRLTAYLELAEAQRIAISEGDTHQILQQVDEERFLVGEITALQRVIDPLKELYRKSHSSGDREIAALQDQIHSLSDEVVAYSRRNQSELSTRMEGIRSELSAFNIPRYGGKQSPRRSPESPSLVDITT